MFSNFLLFIFSNSTGSLILKSTTGQYNSSMFVLSGKKYSSFSPPSLCFTSFLHRQILHRKVILKYSSPFKSDLLFINALHFLHFIIPLLLVTKIYYILIIFIW